jgi:hypothetical protein
MSSRDRRQLKAAIEQHRPQPKAPTVPAELPDDAPMVRLESAGLLFAGSPAPDRPEVRPLTVEFVAMRLHEAMIRKEGRSALEPDVVLRCVKSARLMLRETRRD